MTKFVKQTLFLLPLFFFIIGCSSSDIDTLKADKLSLSSQKSYFKAVELYGKILRKNPRGPRANAVGLKLGKLYLNGGDYSKAIEQFKSVESKEAKELLAQALFKNSDFTGALDIFNKAGDKGGPEYLYFYALTLEKNNLYDQALHIYSKIRGDRVFGARARERIANINLNSEGLVFHGVSDEVKKIIQESPGQEKYPQASGICLLANDNITLTRDNRYISDMHYVIKILNDRGKEKLAEVTLNYDSTYERLELEYARTIKPDGTVVTVGEKNIRDVSLYLNYPLYSNARVRIISMPEVAAGCVIEYKAKLYRSQLPNKKDFNTTYWLASDEPILLERFTIKIPKDRNLKYKIINSDYNTSGFDLNPKISEDKENKIFSLEFKNVGQIIPEPDMPPLSRIDPYILFSTFQSWQDIYVWWRDMYKDKIHASEEIKAKVRELIKDKKTPEERARAIYNFCAQDIRYVAVEYGDAGYEPHRAADIFKNKYGDCKDKTILLISMLESAGIEAFPVLISTYDSFDLQKDLPSILFNHAIAAIKSGDDIKFMDSTGSTVSFSDLPSMDEGRTTLVFFKDKYELITTPSFPPEHNKILRQIKIKLNPDESIYAERKVDVTGLFQQMQRYWLKFTMPVLIEDELKTRAISIADSAVLKGYEIKNVDDLDQPVLLKYAFSAPQFLIKAAKTRIMDRLGGINVSAVVKESRVYPMEYSSLSETQDTIEVELPSHLAVKYLPKEIKKDTKWFSYLCKYEMVNKKLVRFYQLKRLKERIIPISEYAQYKKAIEETDSLVNQQAIFEQIK